MRLTDAYLTQVDDPQNLPPWQGFTVLQGHVDVPLFNDAKLNGHFINLKDAGAQPVFMMESRGRCRPGWHSRRF